MKTDKEIKKEFRKEASINPDTYYPTHKLKELGFMRKQCVTCNKFFWHIDSERTTCGDPECSGGFDLSDGTPSQTKLSYIGVWKKIEEIFNPLDYVSIPRYPVVARWNPTTDFVMASIAAFQPYVVTGEVAAPAEKLVIPQFCLRFGDIDNVGITGSHCTGFVMIGQHAFQTERTWDQGQLFMDIYNFLTQGVGLDTKEITIHEDAWAGGGSFGPCMEFFSRGVELFNQVYTMFEQTPSGSVPLKLKVLDMGLGMERVAWFSQGTPNLYEAVFPKVLKKLRERTGVTIDHELYKKFSKYSAYLNVDEVDDINKAWETVAQKLDMSVNELREKIWPNVGLYSVAEHSRALLFALVDGALPSNTGGGYNLRIIFQRALSFINEFNWDIDLYNVMEWHAEELKELFPELESRVAHVKGIIEHEKEKFDNTKQKAQLIVDQLLEQDTITDDDFFRLYDTRGISPEVIVKAAQKRGKTVTAPDNFYKRVSELHEKQEQIHSTHREDKLPLEGLPETKALYFDNYLDLEFDAKVLKIIDNRYVILDQTYFYPTSGGQLHDQGKMNDSEVVDVFKQDKIIVHDVTNPDFVQGDTVHCAIDKDTRFQLTQHHTATHVINAAAREVLGFHINQAGAKKTTEKAHIDLTHYKVITEDELKQIETVANRIISEDHPVHKEFISKREAEKRYGMVIYQGGAVPGNSLRIVDIEGIDVEACGGTHLNRTGELESIKIVKATKIQDGIVRVEFVAGNRAHETTQETQETLQELTQTLQVTEDAVAAAAQRLFTVWKNVKKAKKKKKVLSASELDLTPQETLTGDQLSLAAEALSTQPNHILKTVKRFLTDIEEYKKGLDKKDE
jgi:alanyl-tRNA synthetase